MTGRAAIPLTPHTSARHSPASKSSKPPRQRYQHELWRECHKVCADTRTSCVPSFLGPPTIPSNSARTLRPCNQFTISIYSPPGTLVSSKQPWTHNHTSASSQTGSRRYPSCGQSAWTLRPSPSPSPYWCYFATLPRVPHAETSLLDPMDSPSLAISTSSRKMCG